MLKTREVPEVKKGTGSARARGEQPVSKLTRPGPGRVCSESTYRRRHRHGRSRKPNRCPIVAPPLSTATLGDPDLGSCQSYLHREDMSGQQEFKWQHESKTGNAGHQNVVSVSREALAEHIWRPP